MRSVGSMHASMSIVYVQPPVDEDQHVDDHFGLPSRKRTLDRPNMHHTDAQQQHACGNMAHMPTVHLMRGWQEMRYHCRLELAHLDAVLLSFSCACT
jgi:hypothetical protein